MATIKKSYKVSNKFAPSPLHFQQSNYLIIIICNGFLCNYDIKEQDFFYIFLYFLNSG